MELDIKKFDKSLPVIVSNGNLLYMDKFKIIVFSLAYFRPSGGDKRLAEVLKCFLRINPSITVDFYTSKEGYTFFTAEGLVANYKILKKRVFNFKSVLISYLFRLLYFPFLLKKHKENLIIYCPSDSLLDVIPSIITKLINNNAVLSSSIFHLIPRTANRRGIFFYNFLSHYSQRFTHILIRKFSDIVFIDNLNLKNSLLKKGFNKKIIHLTKMGINLDEISKFRTDQKNYYACYIGRIHESKGVFDLIDIWKNVIKEIPNANLAIIGSGDDKTVSKLLGNIKISNLNDNITYLGKTGKEICYKILNESKMYVTASYEEGFGISILEALASGVPVIAYKLPVYSEIFNNFLFTVEIGNIKKFSNEILDKIKKNNYLVSNDLMYFLKEHDWNNIAENEYSILTSKFIQNEK